MTELVLMQALLARSMGSQPPACQSDVTRYLPINELCHLVVRERMFCLHNNVM